MRKLGASFCSKKLGFGHLVSLPTMSITSPTTSPHQRQHSHQLRPFILLPDYVTDLPDDLILHLVHHLGTLVGNLATPVSHLATDPCGPTDTNRMGI